MNILFLHNNFPAQFHRIAVALAQDPANRVVFLSCFARKDISVPNVEWRQIALPERESEKQKGQNHPPPLQQGEFFAKAMLDLKKEGFYPDIVHGHVGFGAGLFAREIFPKAMQAGYFEWFYTDGADVSFFGGKDAIPLARQFVQKHSNMCVLAALHETYAGICPTFWQRDQHPVEYHHKLHVIHDGVDVEFFSPHRDQDFKIEGIDIKGAEIVTYATRGLEPYRGFHTFYRALPAVLKERPQAKVLIMADDRAVYGGRRSDGKTWRESLAEEVNVDASRVHFLPFQQYPQYRALLRASDVHVYLTAPFVLSWSMMEALSCGCVVVASDTEPVREVIRHERNGYLTPFWDKDALAERIIYTLENKEKLNNIRQGARNTIVNRYALQRLLPLQINLLKTSHNLFRQAATLHDIQLLVTSS